MFGVGGVHCLKGTDTKGAIVDEREKVEALYSKFGPVVYRQCIRLLEDGENARDATAQVFIRLLANKERFENIDEALVWMENVTTEYCTTWKREAKVRQAQLSVSQHIENGGRP